MSLCICFGCPNGSTRSRTRLPREPSWKRHFLDLPHVLVPLGLVHRVSLVACLVSKTHPESLRVRHRHSSNVKTLCSHVGLPLVDGLAASPGTANGHCFFAATDGCSKYREWAGRWMRWRSDLCAIPEDSRHTEYVPTGCLCAQGTRVIHNKSHGASSPVFCTYKQSMTLRASPFFSICCSRSCADALITHDTYLRSYTRRKPIRWTRPNNNVKRNPKIRGRCSFSAHGTA
jgi:hypothetical protein